ncbi:hypothetical protein [Enterococcus faecium]|nr:hypothetical protein [Enterococcus faecium]
MVETILIGIFVGIIAFFALAVYACCVVAGRADRIEDRWDE